LERSWREKHKKAVEVVPSEVVEVVYNDFPSDFQQQQDDDFPSDFQE
jgi:hypothetical protein